MKRITDYNELQGERYFIFKHSNRCMISARAERTVASVEDGLELPIYQVIVHDERELSQAIAETYGIAHQSPQLILVSGGKAVWNESHHGITAEAIDEAVAAL
jgi:bacillithiol system protein YtxJ